MKKRESERPAKKKIGHKMIKNEKKISIMSAILSRTFIELKGAGTLENLLKIIFKLILK